MPATPSDAPVDQVTVAFAVEISLSPPAESDEMDAVSYGGQIIRDAIAGWGIPVVRIVHLASPDDVFGG
jgi:hypothetical protein